MPKSILQHFENGYMELDADGRIVDFNDAVLEMLGYKPEELTQKSLPELIECYEKIAGNRKAIGSATSSTDVYYCYLTARDGSKRYVVVEEAACSGKGSVIGIRDITDIADTIRVDVVRETLGAIAHEVNNPLQTVKTNLQMMEMKQDGEDPCHKYTQRALAAIDRIVEITGRSEGTHGHSGVNGYKTMHYPCVQGEQIIDIVGSTD